MSYPDRAPGPGRSGRGTLDLVVYDNNLYLNVVLQGRGRQHQVVLHRAIDALVALLDYAPVVAGEHVKVVAQEGDLDLFLREAFVEG